jgi:hypothetical protein
LWALTLRLALLAPFVFGGCALKVELPVDVAKNELEKRVVASKESTKEAKILDALASMGRFCVYDEKVFCPVEPYTPTFESTAAVASLQRLEHYGYRIEAKTIGMKLLPVFDSSPSLLIFMGSVYEEGHDSKGAGLFYMHALHLDPTNEAANFGAARCLLSQKKHRQALKHAKQARERTGLRQKEADDLIEKIQKEMEEPSNTSSGK